MVFHVDYEHNVRNSAQTKAAGLCNVITAFGYVRVEGGEIRILNTGLIYFIAIYHEI